MEVSRRTFIKTTLIGGAGVSVFGFNLGPVYAQTQGLKIARTTEPRSPCPYCSVSCGVIIHTLGDKAKNAVPQVVHVEGDPDHPINRGTLCPKGASLQQDIVNERRLLKPQVRRPGSDHWDDISWDDAVNEIARWTKKTRDATFIDKDKNGYTVNRLETIGWIGGCTDTNELNFLAVTAMRSMGVCYFETQARVWHGPTVSSLGPTFGRGAMTNGWIDIKNTDMMLIMGGNPAENHPCGFKWPVEAKLHRNAKMIVVDPRFTRTATQADLFLQIRAGTDIAFLGGLVNYAIQNNRLAKDYLINYTNAAFIVKEGFKLPEDGLFSGFDGKTYEKETWNYEAGGNVGPKAEGTTTGAASGGATGDQKKAGEEPAKNFERKSEPVKSQASTPQKGGDAMGQGHQAAGGPGAAAQGGTKPPPMLPPNVAYDLSLQHPRSVFQLLKQQYSRYTPEMVERITGIPKDQFLKAADLFTSIRKDGNMKKAGTIIYAVGWTQHTFGTQIIRTAAMLQLLLGNVGRAGGGVNALRGHSNIQGATDMGGVSDIFPGYLKIPQPADTDIAIFNKRTTPTVSKPNEWDSYKYWSNTPKFMASFLKSLYGDSAKKENDFNYQ